MSKDWYFAVLERLLSEGVDYDKAGERAYDVMREEMADRADRERKRRREEQR
jgi:hypothetical protein